jgi:acetylornithine/succinyldiaminopimelate/putrescine aminotransferase
VGALLSSGLRELAERHLLIGDVRGCGLFIGVDLVSDRETRQAATKQASLVCSRLKVRLSQLGKPLSLLLVVVSIRLFTLLLLLLLFFWSPCCVWPLASSVCHLFSSAFLCSFSQELHRVLTSLDGPGDNVLVLKPPLAFSSSDARVFLLALDECLSHVASLADEALAAVGRTPT